ncbi:MAG: hypothetical protein DRI01_07725 [Chloroflexi bacterium]|nr:MAG: hypothetical protein DRI01_07725 [Chloroflexota bacterium]
MESFYAYSLPVRATLEAYVAQEGSGLVAERPIPEMRDSDKSPKSEHLVPLPERKKYPEEKPARRKELVKELRKPEGGLQRLLWRLAEMIVVREMALAFGGKEYRRQVAEQASESQIEKLRELIRHLKMMLWRVVRAIIMPILRLALTEYKESFAELLSRGGAINKAGHQGHVETVARSITNVEQQERQPPQENCSQPQWSKNL